MFCVIIAYFVSFVELTSVKDYFSTTIKLLQVKVTRVQYIQLRFDLVVHYIMFVVQLRVRKELHFNTNILVKSEGFWRQKCYTNPTQWSYKSKNEFVWFTSKFNYTWITPALIMNVTARYSLQLNNDVKENSQVQSESLKIHAKCQFWIIYEIWQNLLNVICVTDIKLF